MRSVLLGLCLGFAMASASAAEAMAHRLLNSVFRKDEGVIHRLDFGRNQIEISGTLYEMALDAYVSQGGIRSAFTLLREEQAVRFTYEEESDGMRRRLIRVLQVVERDSVEEH